MLQHGVCQYLDQMTAVDPSPDVDGQTFPRVLVNQVQQAYRPSIVCEGAHEIVRPDVIRPLRPQTHARSVVEPQTASRLLLMRHLQPFAAPDPLHAVLAYVPARFLQLDGDASVSIPAILSGQCEDGPGQRVFVVPLCRLVALRAAWLVNQLARMTLARPLLPCMFHSDTAPIRA